MNMKKQHKEQEKSLLAISLGGKMLGTGAKSEINSARLE
jgi:hypothetical protein